MVEHERVDAKLGKLEAYLSGLEEKQHITEEAYRQDRDTQDIVERRFEKAIQSCIDIANHIVASEGFRQPTDYGDLFVILHEENILTNELSRKMVEYAGFRNVLAHEYANIQNDLVYEHLQDIESFYTFAEQIHAYTEQQ